VLPLDEATCFLDAPTEKRGMDDFLRARVSVVSVAHRPAVIEASRQVSLVRDAPHPPVASPRERRDLPFLPQLPQKVVPPPRVMLAARPGVAHEAGAAAM